uniref:Uncharacterized protein n=1 Tax=Anguilla anguilla TaxID=7936 RepID=A0A0E9W6H5_ANGAN
MFVNSLLTFSFSLFPSLFKRKLTEALHAPFSQMLVDGSNSFGNCLCF